MEPSRDETLRHETPFPPEVAARLRLSKSFVERILGLKQKKRERKTQDYWDRMQRASSWIAKAHQVTDLEDLEARFIFSWIAINSMYGVPRECLRCLLDERGNAAGLKGKRISPSVRLPEVDMTDLDWFVRRICAIDDEHRVLTVVRAHWPAVEQMMRDPFLQKDYWHPDKPEGDEEHLSSKRRRDLQMATKARQTCDGTFLYTLLALRFQTLRNQLFHGAATNRWSKRREESGKAFEAQTRLVEELGKAFLQVMHEAGERAKWPCVPAPRFGRDDHRKKRPEPCRLRP